MLHSQLRAKITDPVFRLMYDSKIQVSAEFIADEIKKKVRGLRAIFRDDSVDKLAEKAKLKSPEYIAQQRQKCDWSHLHNYSRNGTFVYCPYGDHK